MTARGSHECEWNAWLSPFPQTVDTYLCVGDEMGLTHAEFRRLRNVPGSPAPHANSDQLSSPLVSAARNFLPPNVSTLVLVLRTSPLGLESVELTEAWTWGLHTGQRL
ncbi:hypothetical protein DFH09DRAFT_1082280 [Mycena vulgaris]|nr:hypothetical protein DFH09DRAFT_1082280 [Mycena vulgaris]